MKRELIKNKFMPEMVLGAILLSLFLSPSCGDRSSGRNVSKPTDDVITVNRTEAAPDLIRLVSPVHDDETAIGKPVQVKISHAGTIIPDSVQVWYGGKLASTIRQGELEVSISPVFNATTGLKPLKLMAYTGNKRPQIITVFIASLSDSEPVRYKYSVEKVFPHDVGAYTQGLFYHNGFLYEGTGQEGRSSLRKAELETGKVIKKHDLSSKFFGEGIALINDKVYQLTWTTKVGFTYDRETFRETGKFYYNTEGWGLTTMGERLVMSDGTNKLYIIEPSTFATIATLEVYDNRSMVVNLNELEFINGEIWANIFMTELIARIDPASGKVTGYVDLRGLSDDSGRPGDGEDVLNGIAWDSATDRIFVTGKHWAKLFQIKVYN
jgi:glutaminyl-peptide cyclotransferase